jgi:membrane associated rhomboid family serine protease
VNNLPFSILGGFVMLQGKKTFLEASLLIIVLGGAGVWLLGLSAVHVGASGLIFGYFGFLLTHGWYSRNRVALLVGILTLLLYGSMLWGVVPTRLPVSWEGHLFGLLAGGLAGRLKVQDEDAPLVRV